jgi:hypothetical protein
MSKEKRATRSSDKQSEAHEHEKKVPKVIRSSEALEQEKRVPKVIR